VLILNRSLDMAESVGDAEDVENMHEMGVKENS
jgi:hypothetical protein